MLHSKVNASAGSITEQIATCGSVWLWYRWGSWAKFFRRYDGTCKWLLLIKHMVYCQVILAKAGSIQ